MTEFWGNGRPARYVPAAPPPGPWTLRTAYVRGVCPRWLLEALPNLRGQDASSDITAESIPAQWCVASLSDHEDGQAEPDWTVRFFGRQGLDLDR